MVVWPSVVDQPLRWLLRVTTVGFSIDFGAGGVTLLSNSSVDTTDAGGFADGAAVTFGDTVGGAFDLALTAGADAASDINFDGLDAAVDDC